MLGAGGELLGDSTDGDGFLDSLRLDHGVDVSGLRTVVIGAGGAARAVVLALARAGAAEVAVVNRTPTRAEAAAALAGAAGRVVGSTGMVPERAPRSGTADLVVNATPVGMDGVAGIGPGSLPVDPSRLRPGQVVVDLVYRPLVTPLLRAAADRGARPVDGLGMLVHQAAHQFRRWTGPRSLRSTRCSRLRERSSSSPPDPERSPAPPWLPTATVWSSWTC